MVQNLLSSLIPFKHFPEGSSYRLVQKHRRPLSLILCHPSTKIPCFPLHLISLSPTDSLLVQLMRVFRTLKRCHAHILLQDFYPSFLPLVSDTILQQMQQRNHQTFTKTTCVALQICWTIKASIFNAPLLLQCILY